MDLSLIDPAGSVLVDWREDGRKEKGRGGEQENMNKNEKEWRVKRVSVLAFQEFDIPKSWSLEGT